MVTEKVDNDITVIGVHRCSCGLVVFRRFRFGSLDGREIRRKYDAKQRGTWKNVYKDEGNARRYLAG